MSQKTDFIFWDTTNVVVENHPILSAKEVPFIGMQTQVEKYGKIQLNQCPGMFDFKNQGWIMPAWDEITIFSSNTATMVYLGSADPGSNQKRPSPFVPANPMSNTIADGWKGEEKTLQPMHMNSPWSVQAEDVSLLLLPAVYHSDIWDFIEIYPGVCDYSKKFTTLNVIFAPKKTGVFKIKAGTPLLHMIPMAKGNFNLQIGMAGLAGQWKKQGMYARVSQWYRKYCLKKTRYTVEEI